MPTPKVTRCSFLDAIRRGTCPHYKPGKSPKDCMAYKTEATAYRLANGSVWTIYHCVHEPVAHPVYQMPLLRDSL
jgi:hypothetical protein